MNPPKLELKCFGIDWEIKGHFGGWRIFVIEAIYVAGTGEDLSCLLDESALNTISEAAYEQAVWEGWE